MTPILHKDEYDRLHRIGGPAVVNGDCKHYFVHGKRHRMDGPAVITPTRMEFWENGKLIRTLETKADAIAQSTLTS